jgi:hypothetical protein
MSSFSQSVRGGVALFACVLALPTFAAERGSVPAGTARVDVAAGRGQRAAIVAAPKAAVAAAPFIGVGSNNYRAYPPSCFSGTLPTQPNLVQPLPVTPTGPTYSRTVTLYEKNGSQDSSEDVTITIWRVACSSSGDKLNGSSYGGAAYNPGGGPVGATLMRIQRQAQYEGDNQIYPEYPDIRIAQGSITFDNPNFTDYVRVAAEPNTVVSDTLVGSPLTNSTTYILENYPNPALGFFYFNNAFTIRFDNYYTGGQVTISVPNYNPTQQTYPAAFQPMAINGYHTGSWYVPGHGGEGMLTQIFDNGDGATRTFFAAWYTFNSQGLPFWITAQANFPIGATQLQGVPVYYMTNGGFAGNYTQSTRNDWGTMNVSFPDCQHIKFDYNGSTSAVQGGPGGTGTSVVWTRLIGDGGGINDFACQ